MVTKMDISIRKARSSFLLQATTLDTFRLVRYNFVMFLSSCID